MEFGHTLLLENNKIRQRLDTLFHPSSVSEDVGVVGCLRQVCDNTQDDSPKQNRLTSLVNE
jgi:hypothetical protein